jgi:hypothetical protein
VTDKPILPPKAVHNIDQRMAQCDRFVDGLIDGLVAAVARMAESERNQGETIDSV